MNLALKKGQVERSFKEVPGRKKMSLFGSFQWPRNLPEPELEVPCVGKGDDSEEGNGDRIVEDPRGSWDG